jgi:hypothetical protein
MRSFGIGLILTGLILASASDADAQRTSNKEMNERINALRNRLQNFQLERVRKEPQKTAPINGNETVEVKYEQLLEEFESRKDVAVTVLFHDTEFVDNTGLKDTSGIVVSEKKIVARTAPDVAVVSTGAAKKTKTVTKEKPVPAQTVAGAVIQLESERTQRQKMYEELRRKVQMATRRVHENAQEINGMVAQIP